MHGKLKFLFSISVICFIPTHIFGLSIMFLLQCLIQGRPRSGPCFCRHRIVSLLMLGPLAGIPPAFRWLANSNWPFRVHLLGGGAFPASPAPVLWGDALWAAFKWLHAACPSHYSYKLIFLSSPQQRNPNICWVFASLWANSIIKIRKITFMDQRKKSSLPSSPLQPSTSKPELLMFCPKGNLLLGQYCDQWVRYLLVQEPAGDSETVWSHFRSSVLSVSHTSVSLCNSIKTLSM